MASYGSQQQQQQQQQPGAAFSTIHLLHLCWSQPCQGHAYCLFPDQPDQFHNKAARSNHCLSCMPLRCICCALLRQHCANQNRSSLAGVLISSPPFLCTQYKQCPTAMLFWQKPLFGRRQHLRIQPLHTGTQLQAINHNCLSPYRPMALSDAGCNKADSG